MMEYPKGISQVECVVLKGQVLGVRHTNRFRFRKSINGNTLPQMIKPFLRQIDAGHSSAGAQPLNEIGPRAEANLQHPLAVITCELGKGVDEWLVKIAMRFQLFEVFLRELLRYGVFGPTTLTVPKVPDLFLQTFHGKMTLVFG